MPDTRDIKNDINENMSWLEHETKINEILSITLETRAKQNIMSLAISSISELVSIVKNLKQEIHSLQCELAATKEETANLRKEVHGNMTIEEKELLKSEITNIIREKLPIIMHHITGWKDNDFETLTNLFILCGEKIIVEKSKSFEQGIRIINRIFKSICRDDTRTDTGRFMNWEFDVFHDYEGKQHYSRDNMIISLVLKIMSSFGERKKSNNFEISTEEIDEYII